MIIHSLRFSARCLTLAVLLAAGAHAEPYLAVAQGLKCSQCHVNPTGGGLRNAFGNVFAQTQLPAHRVDTGSDVWAGQLSRYLALGADLRFDAQAQQVPHSKTLEDFHMEQTRDRKSTRLNSSHTVISYAVFCLKKKTKSNTQLQSFQQTHSASR